MRGGKNNKVTSVSCYLIPEVQTQTPSKSVVRLPSRTVQDAYATQELTTAQQPYGPVEEPRAKCEHIYLTIFDQTLA